jgi:hypothetical protein
MTTGELVAALRDSPGKASLSDEKKKIEYRITNTRASIETLEPGSDQTEA